jgi:hypothetical protein
VPWSAPGIGYYRDEIRAGLSFQTPPSITAMDAFNGLEIERELISLGFPDGQFHFRESC